MKPTVAMHPTTCLYFWLARLQVNWICYLEFWLRPTDWCLFERAFWSPSILTPINYLRLDRSEDDLVSVHFSGRGTLGIFGFATFHWIIRISFILLLFAKDLVNISFSIHFLPIDCFSFISPLVGLPKHGVSNHGFFCLLVSSEPV